MRDLADQVDESCSLDTLDLPDIVYVARVRTRRVMTIGGRIGSRLPAHATASGPVLLGRLRDDELDEYLTAPLQTYTQHTTGLSGRTRGASRGRVRPCAVSCVPPPREASSR